MYIKMPIELYERHESLFLQSDKRNNLPTHTGYYIGSRMFTFERELFTLVSNGF